jgi:hypothetical protein
MAERETMMKATEKLIDFLAQWEGLGGEEFKRLVAAVRAECKLPNPGSPDFGEPWNIRCERFYDCDGQLADSGDARRIRIVACVNALRGVRNPAAVEELIGLLQTHRDEWLPLPCAEWCKRFDQEPKP